MRILIGGGYRKMMEYKRYYYKIHENSKDMFVVYEDKDDMWLSFHHTYDDDSEITNGLTYITKSFLERLEQVLELHPKLKEKILEG